MILTDAGPLIALINRNDPHHGACVSAASRLPTEPLLTTWPLSQSYAVERPRHDGEHD